MAGSSGRDLRTKTCGLEPSFSTFTLNAPTLITLFINSGHYLVAYRLYSSISSFCETRRSIRHQSRRFYNLYFLALSNKLRYFAIHVNTIDNISAVRTKFKMQIHPFNVHFRTYSQETLQERNRNFLKKQMAKDHAWNLLDELRASFVTIFYVFEVRRVVQHSANCVSPSIERAI